MEDNIIKNIPQMFPPSFRTEELPSPSLRYWGAHIQVYFAAWLSLKHGNVIRTIIMMLLYFLLLLGVFFMSCYVEELAEEERTNEMKE